VAGTPGEKKIVDAVADNGGHTPVGELDDAVVLLIGDEEAAVGERQYVRRIIQMGAGDRKGRACRLRAVACDRGDHSGGVDAADALIIGIGDVEIAFGIERDVARLLVGKRGRTLIPQVRKLEGSIGGGSAVASESRRFARDRGDDAGLCRQSW
jgi:hypothetical protein